MFALNTWSVLRLLFVVAVCIVSGCGYLTVPVLAEQRQFDSNTHSVLFPATCETFTRRNEGYGTQVGLEQYPVSFVWDFVFLPVNLFPYVLGNALREPYIEDYDYDKQRYIRTPFIAHITASDDNVKLVGNTLHIGFLMDARFIVTAYPVEFVVHRGSLSIGNRPLLGKPSQSDESPRYKITTYGRMGRFWETKNGSDSLISTFHYASGLAFNISDDFEGMISVNHAKVFVESGKKLRFENPSLLMRWWYFK